MRVEGVDAATQQTVAVARVAEPFADPGSPLRVGTFVEAAVEGRTLTDVVVVPRAALRGAAEVLVVDETDGTVARRAVQVARIDGDRVAIRAGLAPGDVVVTTPLATIADGTPVRATIDGQAPLEVPSDVDAGAAPSAVPGAAPGADAGTDARADADDAPDRS